MTPAQRESIVDEANTWLKTPWHHNARVRGAGVDCGQFIIGTYVGAGFVEDFKVGPYARDWMFHREEERYLQWVNRYLDEVETPLPGDVALWRFGRCYSHGAIVIAWPRIIHAWLPERAVVLGDADKGSLAHPSRVVKFFSIAGRLP